MPIPPTSRLEEPAAHRLHHPCRRARAKGECPHRTSSPPSKRTPPATPPTRTARNRNSKPPPTKSAETLAAWFEDQGREADAAPIDLSLSAWQRLRDTELIAKAKLLHQKLTAALATDAAALADYGLDAADATLLAKETTDYEKLIANPAAAISGRKALTLALRPKFREIGHLLGKMDRLVLRFRKTEAGTRFAEAWKAARIIRDLGMAGPAEPTPPIA